VTTPVSVANRPGLDTLHYRVGTYAQFLQSMQARLSSTDRPALAGLRTRAPDDLSMALLDGWAAVADVLTFYTERIATEGYLRTATERFSVLELARLVGYTPHPGLSATSYLAYAIAAGQELTIPPGTKAQSVPGPGELPATFETADPVLARGAYTALPVRRLRPQLLSASTLAGRQTLALAGVLTDARRGDMLLVTVPADKAWALFEVSAVAVDIAASQTLLSVAARQSQNVGAGVQPRRPVVARVENETRLAVLTAALRKPPSVPPLSDRELHRDVAQLYADGSAGINQLLGVAVPEIAPLLGPALAQSTAPDDAPAAITRMRVRAALFGHQAPLYPRYTDGTVVGYTDPMVTPLPVDGGGVILLAAGPAATIDPPTYHPASTLDLDAVHASVLAGSQVVLVNPDLSTPVAFRTVTDVTVVSVNALGLSSRVSRLTLDAAWPDVAAGGDDPSLGTVLRGTTVLAQDEVAAPADESIDDEDVGGAVIELAGLHPDLVPGRWVIVAGERTDAAIKAGQSEDATTTSGTGVPGGELSMIASVEHRVAHIPDGDGNPVDLPGDPVHTFVHLAEPLAFTYSRASVVVHGNVVRATHGETRQEVLGSGDATRTFQQLPLKQPPLTYLPAPTPVGAQSTLSVFVDSVRWNEVPDLISADPVDRRYMITVDQQGATNVVFGDGVHGARPSTGRENIRATYRSGIGTAGNVDAGRITLATSRPLGVTGVTNPLPATGGADAEGQDAVRRNASANIQALDRLVSVSDYEDFSRAFAGIGSASARELSDGRHQLVHVSIAGIDDEPIAADSDLARNLREALLELGDPYEDVRVAIRDLQLLVISARVRISGDHIWADVEPAVRNAVVAAFGPSARRIGEPATSSSLLATMAAVPGVVYVDLNVFDVLDETDLVGVDPGAGLALRTVIPARLAAFDALRPGGIRPAELVLLSPKVHDTLILSELT
jgi:hypothetical protein